MKLINYNYGYIDIFSCSIHGKIKMSAEEWSQALKYLTSKRVQKKFLPSYYWVNDCFKEDIDRKIIIKKGKAYLINIRVPLTNELAKKYSLKRYKIANYMLEINL